jgi:formylglycine-generating enzyme required for sulfatase activity
MAAGGEESVELAGFAIDRNEVTVGGYRNCINRGRCPQPGVTAGETRPNYLLDPAFERFPMVNVDWHAASSYCAFMGKRLPTASEWEVAAGHAPGAQGLNPYPWGEQFQLQRANSARTGLGDAQEVGSYRPSGDSALGAADMAGNVAEWTATNVGRAEDSKDDRFLAKGGSFRDPPAALLVSFSMPLVASFSAPWLGFRCAVDVGSDPAAGGAAAQ